MTLKTLQPTNDQHRLMEGQNMTHGDNQRVSKLENDVDRQTEINQTILDGLREVRDTIKDPERGNMALHKRTNTLEDFRKRMIWTIVIMSGIVSGILAIDHVWANPALTPHDIAVIVREALKQEGKP